MFIAALFTTDKTWKQPKCPTAEWIKKMWYIYIYTHTYNGILLSHKNETMPFCSYVDGPRDDHTKCDNLERDKYHIISPI